jgi:hypothetical protein
MKIVTIVKQESLSMENDRGTCLLLEVRRRHDVTTTDDPRPGSVGTSIDTP